MRARGVNKKRSENARRWKIVAYQEIMRSLIAVQASYDIRGIVCAACQLYVP